MAKCNAYELLEVPEDASLEDIKAAYYQKAKIHHPDAGGQVENFIALKTAYQILSDTDKREHLGKVARFKSTNMRIQPSRLKSDLSTLLQNIDLLKERLKAKENKGAGV